MTNLTQEIIESGICPYPCGWDNLKELIIKNSAFFATSTLDEDFPDEIRQSGIDSGDYALELACIAEKQAETIERLNSRNKRLLNAMNAMRDDLLLGAPQSEDGTIFINVKRDVWEYFCAVIDNTENKLEAGGL